MDKRRHRRLKTRIDVFFSIAGCGIHSGFLLDYSKSGAYVALRTEQQNSVGVDLQSFAGRNIQIHLSLNDKEYLLDGVVAHVAAAGIGVRFANVDALAFSALAEAARREALKTNGSVVPRRDHNAFDPALFVSRSVELVEASFRELIPEFVDDFAALLLRISEQYHIEIESQDCLDSIAILNANRAQLLQCIQDTYSHAIHLQFGVGEQKIPRQASDDLVTPLSLVAKDEFEDWLLVKVAASRAELVLKEPLSEIALRIEACSQKILREDKNPFSPALFFKASNDELKRQHISQGIIKLFLRSGVEGTVEKFSRLYGNVNALFAQMGILPDLNMTQYLLDKKSKSAESASSYGKGTSIAEGKNSVEKKSNLLPNQQVEKGPLAGDPRGENEELARDAFATANRLLRMQRGLRQPTGFSEGAPPNAGFPASADQTDFFVTANGFDQTLFKALIQVCTELSASTPAVGEEPAVAMPTRIVERLKQMNVSFSEDVRDSLFMMDSLVANIADEQRMTGDLRSEFCKMQVPLAALQVADPDIFQSDNHPVRELLNYLALLAEPTSANFKSNAETVKTVINRLMASDPLNEKAVSVLVKDLTQQIDRERSIIQRNVQRVVESCDGRQRINQVNEYLSTELNKRLGEKRVPKTLLRLIDAGWKELMRLSLLRDGPESRSWQTSLNVLDDLLILLGVRPVTDGALHFGLDDLLKIVEKGLLKVSNTNTDFSTLLSEINLAAQAPNVELVVADNYLLKPKSKSLFADSSARLTKKVHRLKVGQWLEYGVKTDNKKLCQVAWISQQHDKFALVNQQGMRVAELSDVDILAKIAEGDIVFLGDGPVTAVEKGLDALIQKIYEKLSFDSSHDQLTGLLSRKEFERMLAQSVARAKRARTRYALIYTDLLQFKLINNLCGYEGGDHLLQQVANALSLLGLEGQVCGRIGGNEFALIVPIAVDSEAFRLACQVKLIIESGKFNWGKNSYSILTAVTLCTFDHKANQVLELLRTVESAAQIAKESGHKEVQMVQPGDVRFQKRDNMMSWVAKISNALEHDQLRLRCQKIEPAKELHPAWLPHYEILLTVVDAAGVHIPPAEFIKAAEEYGRMAEVDRWVITQVLLWMSENARHLKAFGGFSINLSGHTLNDDSFLDFIFEQLVRYDVPRDKVIFEITETTAVANLDEAADFIAEMKEIGCRFSLDDFGAGQSSYAYLKKLPVDFIKIDGAFIRKIDTDRIDFALVKSITEMGHFLSKHIVAEFVSDKAKYDTVVSLGVDYIQGYHVGKPLMLDELLEQELGIKGQ